MARVKKVSTQEDKDRAKDKRLQTKYGITLGRQNEMRAEQNNRCKTCGVEFTAENPPCTDHFHFEIQAFRYEPKIYKIDGIKWYAESYDECGEILHIARSKTKTGAWAAVKHMTLAGSVRGLLCRKCNRGLGYIERFFDAARHPERLLPVLEYFQARLKKP